MDQYFEEHGKAAGTTVKVSGELKSTCKAYLLISVLRMILGTRCNRTKPPYITHSFGLLYTGNWGVSELKRSTDPRVLYTTWRQLDLEVTCHD